MTSGMGAGILGIGIGNLIAEHMRGFAWPIIGVGLLLHSTAVCRQRAKCWKRFRVSPYVPHLARRRRRALPMTETELRLIASAAMIGLSSRPNFG